MLIEFQVLIRIAKGGEITFKLPFLYHYGGAAVIGMEAERPGTAQCLVKEEVHMAFLIIYQSEWRHAAWLQSEILHHSLW